MGWDLVALWREVLAAESFEVGLGGGVEVEGEDVGHLGVVRCKSKRREA